MPKTNDFFFGKKGKVKKAPTLSPEQDELLKLITEGLKTGEGPLKDLFGSFNEGAFNKGVSEPALKNFKENILPALQEKYIAGNQAWGSGMQNAEFKAGTNLQADLAKLMYEAQQGQKQNQLQGLNTALGTKAFENVYKQPTQGVAPNIIEGVAKGATGAIAG